MSQNKSQKSSYKWPKEVPILDGKDFLRCSLYKNEKSCMMGWAIQAFGTEGAKEALKEDCGCEHSAGIPKKVVDVICDTLVAEDKYAAKAKEEMDEHNEGLKLDSQWDYLEPNSFEYKVEVIESINDSKKVPLHKLADVWNKAMNKLGYTKVTKT